MAMTTDPMVYTVLSPKSPDAKAFVVRKAARVTVYGLNGDDTVTFKRIRFGTEQGQFKKKDCCLFEPSPTQIASAVDYQIGECSPNLNRKRNTLIIPYAGSYLPIADAVVSSDLTVEVEPVEGNCFDDKEKGIDPCGMTPNEPDECVNTQWIPTGTERCNQHFVEQEEISNCGNVRWTRTEKCCGYYASVPIQVELDGMCVIGYLFHPNETRDPDATVGILDCDGNLYGYAYPQAGDGHTVILQEGCGDDKVTIGYAVNNSPTAPQITECK